MTLKEKALLLRELGFDAYGWHEPTILRPDLIYPAFPTIYLSGDEDEGQRVVEALQERNIPILELCRNWRYDGDKDPRDICWEVSFNRDPAAILERFGT